MSELFKQFFGPSWKNVIVKLVLGLVLLFLVTFVIAMTGPDVREWSYGWPLPFLDVNENLPGLEGDVFHPLFLIGNILFWYLVVCLIFFLKKRR